MSNFLKVQGGQSTMLHVLSQAEINSAHEGNVEFFQMVGERFFKLRTVMQPGVDPRTPATPVIDAWIPVQGLPEEVEDQLRKANEEDAKVQGLDAERVRSARAEGRMEIPAASEKRLNMNDPNWRDSVQAKELADKMKVGNLSKDVKPGSLPHGGLPGASSTENSQTPGVANEPANAQVKENVDQATGKVPTPENSEAAKPAAPSPSAAPPSTQGQGTATRPPMPGPKGGAK